MLFTLQEMSGEHVHVFYVNALLFTQLDFILFENHTSLSVGSQNLAPETRTLVQVVS